MPFALCILEEGLPILALSKKDRLNFKSSVLNRYRLLGIENCHVQPKFEKRSAGLDLSQKYIFLKLPSVWFSPSDVSLNRFLNLEI